MGYPQNPYKQDLQGSDKKNNTPKSFVARYSKVCKASSNTFVRAAFTLTAQAENLTTNITNPDVSRSIIIKGNASGIAGNVEIHGTDVQNNTITETIALNGANAVEGNKAFKTVTKVVVPAKTNASGDTVSVGIGNKLGLIHKLAHNTILKAYLDNVLESTAATVATSLSSISNNTVKLNSSLVDDKRVDIYYLV